MKRYFEIANDYLAIADFANNVVIMFSEYLNKKLKSPDIISVCDSIQTIINANLNWSPRLYTSGGASRFMNNPNSLLIFRNAASHSARIQNDKYESKIKEYLESLNKDIVTIKKTRRYNNKVEGSIENIRSFFNFIGEFSLSEARNLRESARYPEIYKCS